MNEKKIYKSIGEVAKILNLVNKKNGKLSTHTIRFWEKEFKQIKPKILNGNRRYYDNKTIELLKKVKFLFLQKAIFRTSIILLFKFKLIAIKFCYV